jgi:hypothetical protein
MIILHLDLLTHNSQSRKSANCVLTQDTVSLFLVVKVSPGRPAASHRGSCQGFPPPPSREGAIPEEAVPPPCETSSVIPFSR